MKEEFKDYEYSQGPGKLQVYRIKKNEVMNFSADGDFYLLQIDNEVIIYTVEGCFGPEDKVEPVFEHDCEKCVFLGWFWGYELDKPFDLYFCEQGGLFGPTVIARYGDDGADYQSGLGTKTKCLQMAEKLARGLGLI